MRTRTKYALLILAALLSAAVFVGGCKKSETATTSGQSHQYTCEMHPEVVKNEPGKCPKCGMALIEKH